MAVERDQLPDSAKSLVLMIKMASIVFILLGACCFMFPDAIENMFGFDNFTRQTLGGSLLFVAIIDYFIIPPILIKSLKNTEENND